MITLFKLVANNSKFSIPNNMFKNLHELIATMPDEATCRKYYEEQRWNGKPVCPYCGYERSYKLKSGKHYKCASKTCYRVYTVTVGTKWLMALYLCSAHKKKVLVPTS